MKRVAIKEPVITNNNKKTKKCDTVHRAIKEPFGNDRLDCAVREALISKEEELNTKPIVFHRLRIDDLDQILIAYWPHDAEKGKKFVQEIEDNPFDDDSINIIDLINDVGDEDNKMVACCKPFGVNHFNELGVFRLIAEEGGGGDFIIDMKHLEPRLYRVLVIE